jgi:hypothetical protein
MSPTKKPLFPREKSGFDVKGLAQNDAKPMLRLDSRRIFAFNIQKQKPHPYDWKKPASDGDQNPR